MAGRGVCCDARVRVGSGTVVLPCLSCRPCFSSASCAVAWCNARWGGSACYEWRGGRVVCGLCSRYSPPSSHLPPSSCSLSQHVGAGWCLRGRGVLLRNSGDGLCVRCFVLVHCSLSSSLSSSPFPLLRVGVRGSARAAMRARTLSPNTIVFLVVLSSLFLLFPRLSSRLAFLLFGMAVACVYHVLECSVGMTAIGSLSRSSSFFW